MFERYTEKARRVVFFARYAASEDGADKIEVKHLLVGLLRENSNLLDPYLSSEREAELVSELQKMREESRRESVSTSVDMALSNGAKRVLAYAAEEAESLGHRHIGAEHLLLGLLREEATTPSLLSKFELSVESVRKKVGPLNEARRIRTLEERSASERAVAEGCLEIVEANGTRLAIVGLTATSVIPRINEEVQLSVDGYRQIFRVINVAYRYKINTPDSPYRVNHLAAVQVWVKPKPDTANPAVVPDAT